MFNWALWGGDVFKMDKRLIALLQKLHKIKTEEIAALAEINAALDECVEFDKVLEANKEKEDIISLLDYKVPAEEIMGLISNKNTPRNVLAIKMQELNSIRFNARKFRSLCSKLDIELTDLIKMLGAELKSRKVTAK